MTDQGALADPDWARVSALLDAALALSPAARAEWLATLPPADAPLRATLHALLGRMTAADDDFMRHPVRLRAGATDAAAESALARPGMRVGPYQLAREIGAGGMGTVWLAERVDGALRRRVALKLPRLGWDVRGLAERMARERDILAGLEHANIARLYDAGVDERGRPYLAMEFVEGQPLRTYCDEHGLVVRARLGLFLQVAAAVAHAHARLVVHRDLKPSNILVTADGEVRLLDFGIAKLLEGAEGAATAQDTQLTHGAGRALTPDYAAPEQLRGDAITVAVDVYALGVVLYELLAGRRPPAATAGAEGEHTPRPDASAAAADPARARALRGDLDTILAKALKHSPADRYPTVDAFAADVRRYLAGEPVHARPDTPVYRLSRFVRRHRVPVAIAALAVLAVLGGAAPVAAVMAALAAGAGLALWQAGIARREAARAADEARAAQRERDRAFALLERSDATFAWIQVMLTETAAADERVTLQELLERSEDTLKSLGNEPDLQAAVLDLLASFHMSFGNYAKAESMLGDAVGLVRASHDMTLRARIECNHALALSERGNVEIARRTIESWLDCADVDPVVAALCQQYLAELARNHNDAKGALVNAQGALARLRTTHRKLPGLEASIHGDLAYAFFLNGRIDDAERHYALAVAMHRDVGRGESPTAVAILSNWAIACHGSGDPQRALALIDDVLRIVAKRTPGGTPPPYLVNNRASVLIALGRYDEADAETGRSARIASQAGAAVFALNARVMKARIRIERDELAAAAHALDELAPDAAALPADSFAVLGARLAGGLLACRTGRHADAIAAADDLIRFYDARDTRTGMLASALRLRTEARLAAGDADGAMTDARRGVDVAETLRGARPDSSLTGAAQLSLARVASAQGERATALAAAQAACTHLADTLGDAHSDTRAARALADALRPA